INYFSLSLSSSSLPRYFHFLSSVSNRFQIMLFLPLVFLFLQVGKTFCQRLTSANIQDSCLIELDSLVVEFIYHCKESLKMENMHFSLLLENDPGLSFEAYKQNLTRNYYLKQIDIFYLGR